MEVRVSKSGYDAIESTDPNDFIFHSDYNTFKILTEGSMTSQAVSADPTTFSVAHSKGQIPAVMAFIKYPDGYVTVPEGAARSNSYLVFRYWTVEVDSTNIYFKVYKEGGANYNVDIKYYIFESPIT